MQQGPSSPIRPASTRRRRPTRRQIAARRAFAAIVVVLVAFLLWQFVPSGGGTKATGTKTPAAPSGSSGAVPTSTATATIVPGKNPIKHVIFLVKENHSFDNYFGRYPGADGATTGKIVNCGNGYTPAGTVPLKDAPLIYAHDIGHSFFPGMISINGGKMDGFLQRAVDNPRGYDCPTTNDARCMPGTTLPDPVRTAAVSEYCHQQGVVTLTCGTWGNVLRFLPPLAIPNPLLHEALDVLAEAFAATA